MFTPDPARLIKRLTPWRSFAALVVLLTAEMALLYGMGTTATYVQDDWEIVRRAATTDCAGFFREAFAVSDRVFFRPLGQAVIYGAVELTGWRHPLFPWLHRALLLAGALLTAGLARQRSGSRSQAWMAALLYLSAVTIHTAPLQWAVGVYDLAGVTASLAALILAGRGRHWAAACCILFGLGFKEAVVAVPAIIVVQRLTLAQPGVRLLHRLPDRRFLPYLAALVLYAALKSRQVSALDLPLDDPYRLSLAGTHLVANAARYFTWILHAFIPFFSWVVPQTDRAFPLAAGGTAAAALAAAAYFWRRRTAAASRMRRHAGEVLFLLSWAALALLPSLGLVNHAYRYYLSLALPALAWLAAKPLAGLWRRGVAARSLAAALMATVLCSAMVTSYDMRRLACSSQIDLNQILPCSHSTVRMVRTALEPHAAVLHDHAQRLLFDGVFIRAMQDATAPRLWLDRPDMEVINGANLRRDGDDWLLNVHDPLRPQDAQMRRVSVKGAAVVRARGHLRLSDGESPPFPALTATSVELILPPLSPLAPAMPAAPPATSP